MIFLTFASNIVLGCLTLWLQTPNQKEFFFCWEKTFVINIVPLQVYPLEYHSLTHTHNDKRIIPFFRIRLLLLFVWNCIKLYFDVFPCYFCYFQNKINPKYNLIRQYHMLKQGNSWLDDKVRILSFTIIIIIITIIIKMIKFKNYKWAKFILHLKEPQQHSV